MNKAYQMSDLEHNAFIEHCKATETYKEMFEHFEQGEDYEKCKVLYEFVKDRL